MLTYSYAIQVYAIGYVAMKFSDTRLNVQIQDTIIYYMIISGICLQH